MANSPAEKTLRNVLAISAIDGWSIALFAGLCTLISLLTGGWIGVVVGGLVTAAGVLELRGRARLIRGEQSGLALLVRAQLLILGVIWLYSFENLIAFDQTALMAAVTPEMRSALSQAGVSLSDLEPLVKPVYFGLYLTVIGVTLLFQGGLALYYQSRKARVALALAERTPAPPVLPPV